MDKAKVVMNWSSGKDAALAYHTILSNGNYTVSSLLTTLSAEHERVFMHGIRESLLDLQAERMKLPLLKVKLPASPDDSIYKEAMLKTMTALKEQGVSIAAYGDIFLEDLKVYREQQLQQAGMTALFPLWKRDTRQLIYDVEQAGIEAIVVCVNEKCIGKEFLGKRINAELLDSLPANVDPCGENGEFHTFVYNAPFFSTPIPVVTGEVIHKTYKSPDGDSKWDTGFYFIDLEADV
ncbi:MAG: diphthine--ammonia ligase [Flavipsychrobacter sp.]|nr:diphthine--ammonia ligase [Flavipsychrobacter sp.]